MLVSEFYVILYCEKIVICNSSIKICLNQGLSDCDWIALILMKSFPNKAYDVCFINDAITITTIICLKSKVALN
jgi:hypothetical protein